MASNLNIPKLNNFIKAIIQTRLYSIKGRTFLGSWGELKHRFVSKDETRQNGYICRNKRTGSKRISSSNEDNNFLDLRKKCIWYTGQCCKRV